MPRDRQTVRRRLQEAALELFHKRGYEHTTAAKIAARAGVTERTFFRHFSDKREVLFDGEAVLKSALTSAVADAPHELGPWDALFWAFRSVEQMFVENRPFSEPRRMVIFNNPALQERELAKVGTLTMALAAALQERGVEMRPAQLVAQIGMVALGHAINSWLDDAAGDLDSYLVRAFSEINTLTLRESKAST